MPDLLNPHKPNLNREFSAFFNESISKLASKTKKYKIKKRKLFNELNDLTNVLVATIERKAVIV